MNLETVMTLIKIRGFSPAELARRSGISRQTLTAWKQKVLKQGNPYINLFSETQKRVAQALGVSNEDLDQSIEIISDPKKRQILETELLWDKLLKILNPFWRCSARSSCGSGSLGPSVWTSMAPLD